MKNDLRLIVVSLGYEHNNVRNSETMDLLNYGFNQYKVNVLYKKGDVVYCDIPYEDTETYSSGFNHKNFYEWAINQPYQIFFSSYDNVSDKRFKTIWQNRLYPD